MLSGVLGASAMAPRKSGLKKPRPLRSLSVQEETVSNQDGSGVHATTERKLSFGHLEGDVSADRRSSVRQEMTTFGSWLYAFPDEQKNSEKFKSLSQKESNSSTSSCEHEQVFGRRVSSSSMDSTAFFTSSNWSRQTSSSSDSPLSLEASCFYRAQTSHPQNVNSNSNSQLCHSTVAASSYCCDSRNSLMDETCGSFRNSLTDETCIRFRKSLTDETCGRFRNSLTDETCGRFRNSLTDETCGRFRNSLTDETCRRFRADSQESGEGTHELDSRPLPAAIQTVDTKGQDHSLSFNDLTRGATKVTLVTSKGHELAVSGQDLKTILRACQIILELDASLVKIERVSGDESYMNDGHTSESVKKVCHVTRALSQRELSQGWHYSKSELLGLSMSELSRQPPSLWNVISNIHSDCCLPTTKIYGAQLSLLEALRDPAVNRYLTHS